RSGTQDVFGTLVEVTDGTFTVQIDTPLNVGDPPALPNADSFFQVKSGRETIRVQKEGLFEDFGPGETGPENFIANVSGRVLITDEGGGPLNGFGKGPDLVFVDPLITIPVRLNGGSDNDTLTGGSGGGTLLGGAGDDVLSFATAPSDLTPAERLA